MAGARNFREYPVWLEAVLFAFMSCLNPGDEIIVPEPAYANYMSFCRLQYLPVL